MLSNDTCNEYNQPLHCCFSSYKNNSGYPERGGVDHQSQRQPPQSVGYCTPVYQIARGSAVVAPSFAGPHQGKRDLLHDGRHDHATTHASSLPCLRIVKSVDVHVCWNFVFSLKLE